MLAAAAFNFKRMMRKWKSSFLFHFFKSFFDEFSQEYWTLTFSKTFSIAF